MKPHILKAPSGAYNAAGVYKNVIIINIVERFLIVVIYISNKSIPRHIAKLDIDVTAGNPGHKQNILH